MIDDLSRWDASSPFFGQFDPKPRPRRKRSDDTDDEDDAGSPDLDDKINELIIGEWNG